MLIKFTVKNFKSFEERTKLSMISSSKIRKNVDSKTLIRKVPILKSAVVYGANASGKSNLIEAMRYMRFCITNSIPQATRNMFCKNKQENENLDSLFEVQIEHNNKFYAYGFTLLMSERKITSEWAYELLSNGRSRMLFKREYSQPAKYNERYMTLKDDQNKFNIYAEDIAKNETTLFLSEMNRNKQFESNSKLHFFKEIYDWFFHKLVIFTPNERITNFEYYYEPNSLKKVNKLIESFDTGISKVEIRELSTDDLTKRIPGEILSDIMKEIEEQRKNSNDRNQSDIQKISVRFGNEFFNFTVDENNPGELVATSIQLTHKKSPWSFDFSEESDGTRRLFDLIDMLLTDEKNMVYVIDELERSLHPKLTYHFLKLFKKHTAKQNTQLIFSTHESTVMDQDLLRRDEIWFVERDNHNNSRLYSLDKFKERYDKKISKAYLEGRYGAIPVFKNFQFEGE